MVTYSVPFWRKTPVPDTVHPWAVNTPYGIPLQRPIQDMNGVDHFFWGIATVDIVMAALAFDCPGNEVWFPELKSCQMCPAGEYRQNQTSKTQTRCVPCGSGTYSEAPGAVDSCISCPLGKYGEGERLSSCELCSVAKTQNVNAWTTSKFQLTTTGEIELTQADEATSAAWCFCSEKFFKNAAGECQTCPQGMDCGVGADVLNFDKAGQPAPTLQELYWSSEEEPLSVFKCESATHCPGGIPGRDGPEGVLCGEGLTRQACGRCEPGMYFSSGECKT